MDKLERGHGLLTILLLFLAGGCGLPHGAQPMPQPVPRSNPAPDGRTQVMIFAGDSAWSPEIDSVTEILYNHGVSYKSSDSWELNQLSLEQLSSYRLLIFPGGDAPTMTTSLTLGTRANLRDAVQKKGLSFIGFCAGAWLAISPLPPEGEAARYGIGVVEGPLQEFSFLEKTGQHWALDRITLPGHATRELLWYGGPATPETPGGVVARYSDGKPAISQLHSGNGFVIVSGVHPAATQAVLEALGLRSSEAVYPEFAWQLFEAGLKQAPMPAF